jgi:hypothetical protein
MIKLRQMKHGDNEAKAKQFSIISKVISTRHVRPNLEAQYHQETLSLNKFPI